VNLLGLLGSGVAGTTVGHHKKSQTTTSSKLAEYIKGANKQKQ
jgi:hypothetical protein